MLTIRFDPSKSGSDDRVVIDPPYELVREFILRDIQASVVGARHMADMLRAVIDGSQPPIECETGNMWTMDADPDWATLTNEFAGSRPTVRLPTRDLLHAVERWRDYLIERGVPTDQ